MLLAIVKEYEIQLFFIYDIAIREGRFATVLNQESAKKEIIFHVFMF